MTWMSDLWHRAPWADTPWQVLFGTPLLIIATIAAGVVVRFMVYRLINRISENIAAGNLASLRREQRARTTASVLRSLTTAVVAGVIGLTVLDELTIPVGPLLASAGIVGLAVGFGAQALVKDVISGLFLLVEDQYGVGDTIEIGGLTGTVEAVGLRVTSLRDDVGTLWYLRNGEILKVGNRSQGWGRARVDIGIAYHENPSRVSELLLEVAHEVCADPAFAPAVLDQPRVEGIESVTAGGVVVRLEVKTAALQDDRVARELRRRIKDRLDAAGVHLAYPRDSVWITEPGTLDS